MGQVRLDYSEVPSKAQRQVPAEEVKEEGVSASHGSIEMGARGAGSRPGFADPNERELHDPPQR